MKKMDEKDEGRKEMPWTMKGRGKKKARGGKGRKKGRGGRGRY
jgi:hypothetical protein